jgi:hypothetical protein
MSKIHVLPDENLGGGPNGQILREYVEVDRKAKKDDKIVGKNTGNIYEVDHVFVDVISTKDKKYVHHYDYKVLEPTDIVHIDGARYRLVDRKAKVGDKIIIVKDYDGFDWFKVGETVVVEDTMGEGSVFADFNENKRVYLNGKWAVSPDFYLVLEPVESAELVTAEEGDDVLTVDETEASKSVLDLLANLARRVTELERKLDSAYRRIDVLHDDVDALISDVTELNYIKQPLEAMIKAVKADE